MFRYNRQTKLAEIKRRKWSWTGHTRRKPSNSIERQALDWNPKGSRRKGRPKMTWRRTTEQEACDAGKSWKEEKHLAQNRVRWRSFTEVL
jgi:hypothetical protein